MGFWYAYNKNTNSGGACLNSVRDRGGRVRDMMYYDNWNKAKNALLASAPALYDDFAKFPGVADKLNIAAGRKHLETRCPTVVWPDNGAEPPMADIAHWEVLIPRFLGENSRNKSSVGSIYLQLLEMGHRPYMAMMISMMFPRERFGSGYGDQSPFNYDADSQVFSRCIVRFLGMSDNYPAQDIENIYSSVSYWYNQQIHSISQPEGWTRTINKLHNVRKVCSDGEYAIRKCVDREIQPLSSLASDLKELDAMLQNAILSTHQSFEVI